MATVGIWKITSSLKQVINYTTDKEKTDSSKYNGLNQSLIYVKDGLKTEKQLFVDGINCNPKQALKEMIDIKRKFMKTDGILAWHSYHSYKEGELTPELAHEIGLKVASEMWGDRFQVVVSTHLNRKCLHNHFVVNSVSFIDGKKYYANRTTYAELRRISNVICSEYGLSTLEEKRTKSGINYLNYQNKSLTYTNYYKTAKKDLDIAISSASSYQQFLSIIKNMGYEVNNRAGKLSIKGQDYKRNIRIERYFGEDYSIENITKQIKGIYIPVVKSYIKSSTHKKNTFDKLLKPKYNSFYGMYLRYCNILNNYQHYIKKNSISYDMKQDIYMLEQLSNQAIFLVENNIETEEQFIDFLTSKEKQIDDLKNTREDLWKVCKTSLEKEKIKNKIEEINNEILSLKKELKICDDILARKDKIKDNLKDFKTMEVTKNER